MSSSGNNSLGRRSFFKTTGAVVAGLGIPWNSAASEPKKKNEKKSLTENGELPLIEYQADYVVVGGGFAGTCSAITAARAGLKVVLIQDRPVLGGNASSEVRLWILGATAHMGNNNRWAREGGVHEEILVENMYRNKEGNPVFFDALLIEKVWAEPNITLLLNTAIFQAEMADENQIARVRGFCSQNSTLYEISAPYFCDASGDGILGFLAGAAFRQGAETADVFGEKFFMPDDFGKQLGHSMYFYSKDAGVPVKYVPPAFALKDIPAQIPRFRDIQRDSSGCRLWWLEWGGELDRVFDSEKIKDELWKVIYGVWDYIKNSGIFNDVENLTLEWASTIPGKRESRRFEGDYTLVQQDVINQNPFEDAIAHGGWAIDLHPSDGVFSSYHGCTQYHSKGVYTIPYRCIYSRNVSNLFFAGRIISVSHIAFGSTRVISTGTLCGQAAALAAKLCTDNHISPREVYEKGFIPELQKRLIQTGQYLPRVQTIQTEDLVQKAIIETSSTFKLAELPADGTWRNLNRDSAMLLPLKKGVVPAFIVQLQAESATNVEIQLYASLKKGNFTPDKCLSTKKFELNSGDSELVIDFNHSLEEDQYAMLVFKKNSNVSIAQTEQRITGIISLFGRNKQEASEKFGFEEIPFMVPERRPGGKNFALKLNSPLKSFEPEQLKSFVYRPGENKTNVWIAAPDDKNPEIQVRWTQPQEIKKIVLWFDTDFDHAMESCLMGHPENVMPFCVEEYSIYDSDGKLLYEAKENHHSRNEIILKESAQAWGLRIQFKQKLSTVPVSVFGIQAFS